MEIALTTALRSPQPFLRAFPRLLDRFATQAQTTPFHRRFDKEKQERFYSFLFLAARLGR